MASFLDDLNNHKFSTRKPKEEKINIKPPGRKAPYQAPPDHSAYQRAVVKVHHSAPANLARHNQYITREGVGVDGQKPELFTDDGRKLVNGEIPKEGHYTTIILSPDKGHELDLQQYTKDFMRQMETDTDQKLHWYAAVHTNTDHPHVHIVIRGRNAAVYKDRATPRLRYDSYGKQTYFQHEYVKHGMRRVAQKVATNHLGYRTDREIRRQERQELTVDRLTALDRSLAQRNEKLQLTRDTPLEIDRKLAEKQELSQLDAARPLSIDRKLHGSAQAATDGKFTPKDKYEQKRLDTLVGLELAHKHSDDTYSLTQDWQKELRQMQRSAPEGSPGHLVPETKEERQRLNALVKMGFARWHGARGYSLNDDWQLALKKRTPSGQQPEIKPANSDQAKRLEHLKELGLATETTRYTYQLKPNWQKKLRELGHKNDIVKQIHKDAPLSIEAGAAIANNKVQIQGRVVRKDYENEDLKKPYIIIHNNTDGKYYYYASKTADAAQQDQFVRLDKGSLQNEMGEQIHRATPYQTAKSRDTNAAPENPAHPMTAEEYQKIKELAFQSAQREHGETANREYTQSAKWSVRGTVAYADYNEKLGRSIVIIRDKNAANYYYTESSDPKHGNIELNQEAVYVGQEIKIGDEAHAYWTDRDVKDHALSDIQEQHPKKDVESSKSYMLGSSMDVTGTMIYKGTHPRDGSPYTIIESHHPKTGAPVYFYDSDETYQNKELGTRIHKEPNTPPEAITEEEYQHLTKDNATPKTHTSPTEQAAVTPQSSERSSVTIRERASAWAEQAREISEKPHAPVTEHTERSRPTKGLVVTSGYDPELNKHVTVVKNKDGLHIKQTDQDPKLSHDQPVVLSGSQATPGDKTSLEITQNDTARMTRAGAALPKNAVVQPLAHTNGEAQGRAVYVTRNTNGEPPTALIQTGANTYTMHTHPDYTHVRPGDTVSISANAGADELKITRPAPQNITEKNEKQAQAYWLQQAQQRSHIPQQTKGYPHTENHDTIKGTVLISEVDGHTNQRYTVIENKEGLHIKTEPPSTPQPTPGEKVAFSSGKTLRGNEVNATTTRDERITAAIKASGGNEHAPTHTLDRPDREAAGKVIARGDHPSKEKTGYAVIEATYSGGKKAYFYQEDARYASNASSPIREGDHVYTNTTSQEHPKKIKEEYIATLNSNRSPDNPLSEERVDEQKRAQKASANTYAGGRKIAK